MTSKEEKETNHIENLKKLCRICGNRILLKGRKPKQVIEYRNLLKEYFGLDVESDGIEIHPCKICENCRKIFSKMNLKLNSKKKEIVYMPQIKLHDFVPHQQENCYVCNATFVGRGKKPCKVNSATMETNVQISNQFSSHTTEPYENPVLDFETVRDHKKSVFTFIETEHLKSFMILCPIKEPLKQLKTLLCLNIHSDYSWKVSIMDCDVSGYSCFEKISKVLSTEDACLILDICSNIDLCIGNEDFSQLCSSRREDIGLVKFYDRQNNLVAHEQKDLVCESLGLSATIRHVNCDLITKGKENMRCVPCTKYRATLTALNHKVKSQRVPLKLRNDINLSSNINNKYLTKPQLTEKLQKAQSEKRKAISKNNKLQERINILIEKNGVTANDDLHSTVTNVLNKNLIDFPDGSAIKMLFDQQIKFSKLKTSKTQMRWHPIIIRWALGLYHTSPSAYDFLRRSSFLHLPHKSTLLDYSIYTTPKSGFNVDVIKRLYVEANLENLEEYQKNVSLLYDEMKIKSDLAYHKSSGKLIGFVELGDMNDVIDQFERQCSEDGMVRNVATHVLAFMVRGIYTDLQFVFGYFPTQGASCHQLFPCVWEAVSVLESIGFMVRCFVSDGASPNRSFYKLHVSANEIPYFAVILCASSRKIYFICDVPHLLKTVRNNWENSHGNKNTRNLFFKKQVISWNHLVSLWKWEQNLQTPGLYMTKIRSEHINLSSSSRMSVRLAAQCLSSRVANALEFRGRHDTKGTEEFARMFDFFFDCLNGQYKDQGIHSRKDALQPYLCVNDQRFYWLEVTFLKDYIIKWETEAMNTPNLTNRDKGKLCLSAQTLEGLKMTVKSFVSMAKELILENPGLFLLSGRFSQDPLEQHFSAQRRRCGNNTNPSAEQYGYNELALHTIKSKNVKSLKGNCSTPGESQVTFMELNEIPVKRRKR